MNLKIGRISGGPNVITQALKNGQGRGESHRKGGGGERLEM